VITNERQYKITFVQAQKFAEALAEFDSSARGSDDDLLLIEAERQSLRSQYEELQEQLYEYESLRSGKPKHLAGYAIETIADLLIAARIAKNLTQRELAERVGVNEQQIQRYEAERYQSASLRRLIELYHALELNVSILVNLEQAKPEDIFSQLYSDTAVISE
jgi:HTH-type transcriptional regulator/antitoxin HigA